MRDTMQPTYVNEDNENHSSNAVDIIKKWHKYGFISISYWAHAQKVIIEIGSTKAEGSENKLTSATKCFVPVHQFLGYLRSEISDTVEVIYPQFPTKGVEFFGGGKDKKTGEVVSRIFKAGYWTGKAGVDEKSRAFKCEHYKGTLADQGAIIPKYNEPAISRDGMKITMADIAEIFEKLSITTISEATAALIIDED